MRILLDTNFLYSALFHPTTKFDAIIEYVFTKCEPMILEYVADELIRKAKEKRPESLDAVLTFLEFASHPNVENIQEHGHTPRIRDRKDQPILDAAVHYGVDIVISGDKDFTSLDIERPRILTPAAFIAEFLKGEQ